MTHRQKMITLLLIVTVSIASDQISKYLAITYLKGQPSLEFFFGTVLLIYAENTGAFGSLGSDWSPGIKKLFFNYLPVAFFIYITFSLFKNTKTTKREFWGYCFILGGGTGNLIDRFLFGYVVDFMYMGIGKIGTNIFNIADVLLMGGMFILIYDQYQISRSNKKATSQKEKG